VLCLEGKRGKLIISALSVVLLGISIYILAGVFWTGSSSQSKEDTKPAISSIKSLEDLKDKGSIRLTAEDINKLLTLYESKTNNNSPELESIKSDIKSNKLSFSALVRFHGIKLLLSTNGKLEYTGSVIAYSPDYFKVGKVSLPKGLVYSQLRKYITVNTEKDRIELEKNKLPMDIASLQIEDDKLNVKLGSSNISQNLSEENPDPYHKKSSAAYNKASSTLTKPAEPDKSNETSKKPSSSTPSGKASASTVKKNLPAKDVLTKANSDLSKVYSSVKTTNEKQLVQSVQSILQKVLKDENYPYEKHAAEIQSKYDKLTSSEKEDLEDVILGKMDISNLLRVWNVFNEK
jgi:hypothetical protein